MLFKRHNTRKAVELGTALADQLAVEELTSPSAEPRKRTTARPPRQIQGFLQQIDRQARPLQLSFFGRTRLVHSFKWRLLEKGVAQETVDELTEMLLMRLSGTETATAQPADLAAPPPSRTNPRKAEALLAEADQYLSQGANAEAADAYMRALELNPRHAIARNNLGTALCLLGRYLEAREQFRRAVALDPRRADAHANLGSVLLLTGHAAEAEAPLRRALKLDPKQVEAQAALARGLLLRGRLREATEAYAKALKVAPGNVPVLMGLGQIAAAEGRFDEAETFLKRALQSEPQAPGPWAALAGLRKMTSSDAGWLDAVEKIAAGPLAPLDEATIRFAIGKYYDDVGDFKRAFASYRRANELQKKAADGYDRQQRSSFIDDSMRLYTREAFSRERPGSSNSAKPVLVVGMMRSGTSLVEQIIASHPAAAGAGELEFWNDSVRKRSPDVQRVLPDEQTCRQLSTAYLQTLGLCSTAALRVVDKATLNSDYLGLIHSVFPRARIIYVQRDPIDTCLSCYFQQFSTALSFAMDLEDLAHYYREHHRLAAHWRKVLPPGTMLDVPYAELVADQEGWTRRILEFIGLEWDQRVLAAETTTRPVLTASNWQVRQKIYKGSVGRWRNYEKFVEPLLGLRNLRT